MWPFFCRNLGEVVSYRKQHAASEYKNLVLKMIKVLLVSVNLEFTLNFHSNEKNKKLINFVKYF